MNHTVIVEKRGYGRVHTHTHMYIRYAIYKKERKRKSYVYSAHTVFSMNQIIVLKDEV